MRVLLRSLMWIVYLLTYPKFMPIETKSFVGRRCCKHFCKARDCRRFLPAAGWIRCVTKMGYPKTSHTFPGLTITADSWSSQQCDTPRNWGRWCLLLQTSREHYSARRRGLLARDVASAIHACTSTPLRPTFVCDINDISGYALGVSSSSPIPPTLLLSFVYKGIVKFQYKGRLGDARRISQDIII
jgi:hypothetical protein